jgi:GT2 family glycosyltransferase
MTSIAPQPPAPSTARLDVVIVNWNSGVHLRRCLESIASSSADVGCLDKLIIVDNASTDGSADLHGFAELLPLRILSNAENRGFAAACNQGAATGNAGVILFLNPDVRIRPEAFTKSLDFLLAGAPARVGAVGAKLMDDAGVTLRTCARFPTPVRLLGQSAFLDRLAPSLFTPHFMLEWDHETTRSVDQVMGAFFMVPRSLFECLEGFDERFFVYFEEVDLCLRMKRKGWSVIHCAEPSAAHEGQGTTHGIKDLRLFYSLRSRLLYAAKNFSRGGLVVALIATLVVEPCARIAAAVARGSAGDFRAVLNAYRMLLIALPRLSLFGHP